jgi:tetratricopeptide (TPR) repeat protein
VRLSAATGLVPERAYAAFLVAKANRALGDTPGAIAAYDACIEAASETGDSNLLAVAHDNVGNALADVGRLDEALAHYQLALQYEKKPQGRFAIRSNQANAFASLGELRSAAQVLEDAVQELEAEGAAGRELAIALDNAARPISQLGDLEGALQMLERARRLYQPTDVIARAVNSLSRSNVYLGLNRNDEAGKAFTEAYELALEDARSRVDQDTYRRGWLQSLASRLPADDLANELFVEGIAAREGGDSNGALQRWAAAAQRAQAMGDREFALRIEANVVSVLADRGQVTEAIELAQQTRSLAGFGGFALPELMVVGTLESLAADGADIHEALGPVGMLAASFVLRETLEAIVEQAGLDRNAALYEVPNTGAQENNLAKLAVAQHADELAIQCLKDAVQKARASSARYELANRLSGLLDMYIRTGKASEARAAAKELEGVIGAGLPDLGKVVAHRALGFYLVADDRPAALKHFRQACDAAEALRLQFEPGPRRAATARRFGGLYMTLARFLREDGDDIAAFEALQGEKSRRLIDTLAVLGTSTGGPVRDEPPTAAEVMALLERLDSPDACLVDLAVEPQGLTGYVVSTAGVKSIHVPGSAEALRSGETGDVHERESRLVQLCNTDSLVLELARRIAEGVPTNSRLMIVPDAFLYNFPLHAIPVNGKPWCDSAAVSYLAAAGALRFMTVAMSSSGRSLVAGNSRDDLPHAEEECLAVALALGTKPFLRQDCNRDNLTQSLQAGDHDVVHLAVHGRSDPRRGGRASLLLADGKGGTEWVPFDALTSLNWQAKVVVLSGCGTAVAGPQDGFQLAGVALAAAEAGAATVIACLWPVGDEAAEVFMKAFYASITKRRKGSGEVDLRDVCDDARTDLRGWLAAAGNSAVRRRDGREITPEEVSPSADQPRLDPVLADTLVWAPFVLVGDPKLRVPSGAAYTASIS